MGAASAEEIELWNKLVARAREKFQINLPGAGAEFARKSAALRIHFWHACGK